MTSERSAERVFEAVVIRLSAFEYLCYVGAAFAAGMIVGWLVFA